MTDMIGKKSHASHHILFIIACAQNVLLQRECKRQTLTPLANSRLNNPHFTKVQPFALSFFLMLHTKNDYNRQMLQVFIQKIQVACFL